MGGKGGRRGAKGIRPLRPSYVLYVGHRVANGGNGSDRQHLVQTELAQIQPRTRAARNEKDAARKTKLRLSSGRQGEMPQSARRACHPIPLGVRDAVRLVDVTFGRCPNDTTVGRGPPPPPVTGSVLIDFPSVPLAVSAGLSHVGLHLLHVSIAFTILDESYSSRYTSVKWIRRGKMCPRSLVRSCASYAPPGRPLLKSWLKPSAHQRLMCGSWKTKKMLNPVPIYS